MSERQENQLESDAVEVDFAALSTASSLDCLLDHSEQISLQLKPVTKAYVRLFSGKWQGNKQELVSRFENTAVQLASAVRRACELLGDLTVLQGGTAPAEALAQDGEVPGCSEASHLMALLGQQLVLMQSWLSGKPRPQADCMKLKIASSVASSGMLPSLARLCDMVAATVVQQQGQQQQLQLEVQQTAQVLMELTVALLVFWPGKWFSGRTLAPVLPSLLRLLVSALCNSSSGSWLDGRVATYFAGAALPQLVVQIRTELEPVEDAVTEGQLASLHSLPSETVDILQSHAVQHLPLLAVASLMEQLHEHKTGTGEYDASSSTQQQQRQQVPAAHEELYRAVGLSNSFFLSHDMSSDSTLLPDLLFGLIDASTTVLTCQAAVQAHSCISCNSINSSNRRPAQQRQQEMLVQPRVCYTLLLVAVEVLELYPHSCTIAASMLTWMENLLTLLEFQLSTASTEAEAAAPRPSGTVLAVYHNAAEVQGYMQRSVEVVLLQLIPVVLQSLRNAAAGAGNSEDASSSNSRHRQTICSLLVAQLLQRIVSSGWTLTASSDATAVLTAYQQDPVTTLSSLEAGLRLLATQAAMNASATQKAYCRSVPDVLLSHLAALVVDLRAMTAQHTTINAEPEQQQKRLISLVTSMLKCCKRLRSPDRDWQLVGLVAMVLEASLLVAAAAAGSSKRAGVKSPSSSSSTVEASLQTHVMVLVGRCVLAVADFVLAQLSTSSNRDQLLELLSPDLWLTIKTMLPQVTTAVQLLQRQAAASVSIGSTSATVEVVPMAAHTLQQQAVSLQDRLAAAQGPWQELQQQPLPQTEEVPGSPGTFELIPDEHVSAKLALTLLRLGFGASGEIAEQLGEFAAAVCAAVPVSCCCNNPGCDKLSGFSDMELVSGKSCVCARCQVARYCGRECQVAHWPQHKAACKRIKASKKVSIVG